MAFISLPFHSLHGYMRAFGLAAGFNPFFFCWREYWNGLKICKGLVSHGMDICKICSSLITWSVWGLEPWLYPVANTSSLISFLAFTYQVLYLATPILKLFYDSKIRTVVPAQLNVSKVRCHRRVL
jgi:hypothetical protein